MEQEPLTRTLKKFVEYTQKVPCTNPNIVTSLGVQLDVNGEPTTDFANSYCTVWYQKNTLMASSYINYFEIKVEVLMVDDDGKIGMIFYDPN